MVKKFARYYRPYKRLFALTLVCGLLVAILELLFPLAVNRVIDDLLPNQNWGLILAGGIGLLILYFFNGGFHYVVTYWGHKLGINIETDMRTQLYNHLQEQPIQYFDDTKSGHLISRLTNDLMDIGEIAHHGPEELIIALMTLTGAFAIMLTISWELAVMTFTLVPIIMLLTYYFGKKMSLAMTKLFGNIADFSSRVENNITGIRVIKAFANENFEKKRFAHNNDQFRKTKLSSYKIMAAHISLSQILMKVLLLFVLVAGTWFVIQGQLTNGEFIAFVLLTNVMIRPMQQLNNVIEMYPKGIAGFRRFLDLLEMESVQKEKEDAIVVNDVDGRVVFEDVSFSYQEGQPVLENVDFQIQPSETIAFVGPSGAGKTTIISLLPRFYDITSGSITIDGIDIRDMTLSSLREKIGVVQQDVFLFDGTIRENISYGKLGASEEEIWSAARRAQLTNLIDSLPDGIETVIGERGVKLSGGQKQRLSIARMFLKNPPILILDEATSALDTETEAAIQQALTELAIGRTTIVVAHRLATIKEADRILVVTEKGIAEEGSHQELVKKEGLYSRMHRAQFDFDIA